MSFQGGDGDKLYECLTKGLFNTKIVDDIVVRYYSLTGIYNFVDLTDDALKDYDFYKR